MATDSIVKHSAGPWVIHETHTEQGGHIRYVLADTGHIEVAVLYSTTGQQEANARLIAAAPDLLAACHEVLHHADDESGFLVLVRAAIVKAEVK